ncbi:acetyl esterase/lipase [Trinickia symbiotica]|uniref:Acetyl esterase n=1 Tax=Trinickia symbiotica TaxID=863227 RepID=A0A2N7X7U5_9BURK|nr:alpha/beta hydrolase [Trinickia symbiotica]PMS37680.1 acetyl esterase [Trinickia symbiotica]PPK44218.1 acetyl esterase/lipase [Trinickia symbiotica]
MGQSVASSNSSKLPALIPRILVGASIVLIINALLFRLTPWPGAIIIRSVFEWNAAQVTKALEAHQPKVPITLIADQQYRNGDGDALLDVYYPQSTQGLLPVVIWTHGGAWISGSKSDAAPYYRLIAAEGLTVIAPDYTLAPKKSYPVQINQLNDAYAYILKNARRFHADTSRIFFAGDSAGAQLSSQMAALITNADYAKVLGISPNLKPSQLKGVILYCGIYQMDKLANPDPTLSWIVSWGNDVAVWAYSGVRDFSDPIINQMSPQYHVTKNFPATFMSGGNADPLTNVQSKPLAEKLRSLGAAVDTLFFPTDHQPQLAHEYQFDLDGDDGKNALVRSLQFLKAHI